MIVLCCGQEELVTEVAELKAARDQLASALREKEDEMAALVSTHEQDFEEVQTELGVTHAKQKRRERELKERHARELHDAKLEGQQASEDVLQLKAEMDALRQRHAVEIHNKNVQLDEAEVTTAIRSEAIH